MLLRVLCVLDTGTQMSEHRLETAIKGLHGSESAATRWSLHELGLASTMRERDLLRKRNGVGGGYGGREPPMPEKDPGDSLFP